MNDQNKYCNDHLIWRVFPDEVLCPEGAGGGAVLLQPLPDPVAAALEIVEGNVVDGVALVRHVDPTHAGRAGTPILGSVHI